MRLLTVRSPSHRRVLVLSRGVCWAATAVVTWLVATSTISNALAAALIVSQGLIDGWVLVRLRTRRRRAHAVGGEPR